MVRRNLSRQATAFHEAGHTVAAVHHRVRVAKVTIRDTEEVKGFVSRHNLLRNAQLDIEEISTRRRIQIEHLVLVSYAGPIAQRCFNARSYRHYHATADRKEAINLASYLAGSNRELEAHLKWLWVRTEGFIERTWPQIETVAGWLLDHETVTGNSIKELVFPRYNLGPSS
jgi:hypothetical protein